jgi:hypothetical protein
VGGARKGTDEAQRNPNYGKVWDSEIPTLREQGHLSGVRDSRSVRYLYEEVGE